MRKGRFSEEQIIKVLKEQQAGIPVVELSHQVCSHSGSDEPVWQGVAPAFALVIAMLLLASSF
jgi:hypothetical protein